MVCYFSYPFLLFLTLLTVIYSGANRSAYHVRNRNLLLLFTPSTRGTFLLTVTYPSGISYATLVLPIQGVRRRLDARMRAVGGIRRLPAAADSNP